MPILRGEKSWCLPGLHVLQQAVFRVKPTQEAATGSWVNLTTEQAFHFKQGEIRLLLPCRKTIEGEPFAKCNIAEFIIKFRQCCAACAIRPAA